MKWVVLIVVLIVAGMLFHQFFLAESPANTPHRTVERFFEAALANDMSAVAGLCEEEAVSSARDAARQIHATESKKDSFLNKPSWKRTATKADAALTTMIAGKLLTVEFKQAGEAWKITAIAF